DVSPNYLIQYQNGNFQTNTGAFLGYMISDVYQSRDRPSKIILGAWYRLQDSFIFNVGLVSKNFDFAFSYDINTSSLGRFTGSTGSYEISLKFRLIKQDSFRRFSSPLI
ncbi:type IX secretion system membrane protein PorP/SprF, partial [Fulvivirga sp. RKSG066]|uniref:type IX secretion system membrane protein PorP/SprF n=1 Tax=Fulvivirga aurantia TaxID=2529383 RepID=UPI0012BD1CE7